MIAIRVELLTGRAVLTSFNDRSRAEWPPHPARLYSALVAVYKEDHPDDGILAEALDWLASAGDPEILASTASSRAMPEVFVPGKGPTLLPKTREAIAEVEQARREGPQEAIRQADKKLLAQLAKEGRYDGRADPVEVARAARQLPNQRSRLPRTFPCSIPILPRVYYVWPQAEPSQEHRTALERLLRGVARLGHSSSLVACSLTDASPELSDDLRRWVPDERGQLVLRVVSEGQRAHLEEAFHTHQGYRPRILPCRFQPYRLGEEVTEHVESKSVFEDAWWVFREVGSGEPGRKVAPRSTLAADVALALRGALMRHAEDPPPAALSGHAPDGSPLELPHAAFISLADVDSPWSDGAILGVALVLPRDCPIAERNAIARSVARWEEEHPERALPLRLGRAGVMKLERIQDIDPRRTLQPSTWCGPARRWATVTPVALDRNPGNLSHGGKAVDEACEIIARACELVNLPRPTAVDILESPFFRGSDRARSYMPFPRKTNALRRVCVHAELVFPVPVLGPVLLGAGRYQGLGLLRPCLGGAP